MGSFEAEIPQEIIEQIAKLEKDANGIFKGMTSAAADVVVENVKNNLPAALRESNFAECVGKTKPYDTPSDGGVATKVTITGYFDSKQNNGKKTPAPLVANVFEYGTTERRTDAGAHRGRISKRPFFRKSFNARQITEAMLEAQRKLSGGVLDE